MISSINKQITPRLEPFKKRYKFFTVNYKLKKLKYPILKLAHIPFQASYDLVTLPQTDMPTLAQTKASSVEIKNPAYVPSAYDDITLCL